MAGSSIPSQPAGAQARATCRRTTALSLKLDRAEHRHIINGGGIST
jgi:hypothetical protein